MVIFSCVSKYTGSEDLFLSGAKVSHIFTVDCIGGIENISDINNNKSN